MSTQKSKLSSSDDDGHPASGERPALRYLPEPSFPENEAESAGFSATCENTSLSDWIQLVQMNRRDAVIGIKRHDGKKALLWCRDGDIIDAWCDGVIGEDAVYRALTWEGGQVSVAFAPFEHDRQIEIATPALLLRAAYRKDSGVRQLRPEARTPSSVAPALTPTLPSSQTPPVVPPSKRPSSPALPLLVARASAPPPARPEPLPSPSETPPISASSPPAANLPEKVSEPAPDPLTEPAASPPSRRRTPKRAWLLGIALGVLPLLGLTASWWLTPKRDVSLPAPPRKISTHADPSRVEVTTTVPGEASPGRDERLAPPAATTAARPPPRVAARAPRAAAAPRQAAVAALKAPPIAAPKVENKSKPSSPSSEVRAPRVQIIDERESKIEVIE